MTDTNILDLFSPEKEKKTEKIKNKNKFSLEPEIYYGNTEYKLLIKPDKKRKNGLATQMGFRLREGCGRAVYWLGIMDDGYALGITEELLNNSITHMANIAGMIGARIKILSKTNIGNCTTNLGIDTDNFFFKSIIGMDKKPTPNRYIASVEVLTHKSEVEYNTITIGVVGNVNAGKSTLIGTLATGKEDDGKGRNRTHVANHLHELSSGRTSSIGHIILGYVNEDTIKYYEPGIEWSAITKESKKIIKFFDLAGHEKYLKTTIKGLTHNRPDYVLITIEASKGITDITKQHITLCRVHEIPCIILITKVDTIPRQKYMDTHKDLGILLKTHFRLNPTVVCDKDDAIRMTDQLHKQLIKSKDKTIMPLVPVIDISCVTGEGLDLLKTMLYRLKQNNDYNSSEKVEVYLDTIYERVSGVGLVVSGIMTSGTVEKGQQLNMGPDINGKYEPIKIKCIHVDKQIVDKVTAGHHCSFAIVNVPGNKINLKKYVKKDMVILDNVIKPSSYKTFDITVKMLNIQQILDAFLKKITLGIGSGFIIQFNNIRRAAIIQEIYSIDSQKRIGNELNIPERIYVGDVAKIRITLESPAYIKKDDTCVLTESHLFGIGTVDNIIE